jgi:hypothetical protein
MTGSAGPFDAGLEDDPVLADLVEEFANRLQRGEAVDASAYAREHPERAEKLRQLLPGVQVLADLGQSGPAPARPPWATSGSCGRSAGAAWGWSSRPSSSRWAGGWR